MHSKYPYLVIRLMAAVYRTRDLPNELSLEELIARVRAMMKEYEKFRMCIVFGPKEALILELDGTQIESYDPLSGGLDIPLVAASSRVIHEFRN